MFEKPLPKEISNKFHSIHCMWVTVLLYFGITSTSLFHSQTKRYRSRIQEAASLIIPTHLYDDDVPVALAEGGKIKITTTRTVMTS